MTAEEVKCQRYVQPKTIAGCVRFARFSSMRCASGRMRDSLHPIMLFRCAVQPAKAGLRGFAAARQNQGRKPRAFGAPARAVGFLSRLDAARPCPSDSGARRAKRGPLAAPVASRPLRPCAPLRGHSKGAALRLACGASPPAAIRPAFAGAHCARNARPAFAGAALSRRQRLPPTPRRGLGGAAAGRLAPGFAGSPASPRRHFLFLSALSFAAIPANDP
jgi:hypothetical protein